MTDVATPSDGLMRTPGATIAGIVGSLGLVAAIWAAEHIRTGAGVDVAAVTLATCYARPSHRHHRRSMPFVANVGKPVRDVMPLDGPIGRAR